MPLNATALSGWQASSALGIGMTRAREELGGVSGFHELAGIDDTKIITELCHHAEIMSHKQHRQPELDGKLAQQIEDLLLGRYIEGCRRLVGYIQRRCGGQCRRDHQALPLTAGKLVRAAFEGRLGVGQSAPALATRRCGRDAACLGPSWCCCRARATA